MEAIKKSIARLIGFYHFFEKAIEQNKILDSKSFHAILQDMGGLEVENDAQLFATFESVSLENLTGEYDRKQLKKDLQEDLNLLEPLKHNLDRIMAYSDRKLTALKELLARDQVFETGGKKIIIFTQFVDTAKYLYDELANALKRKEVRILTRANL